MLNTCNPSAGAVRGGGAHSTDRARPSDPEVGGGGGGCPRPQKSVMARAPVGGYTTHVCQLFICVGVIGH